MENQNHEKVFRIITYIIRYIATYWAMLFYPKRTLAEINSTKLVRFGSFLLINMVLALSAAQFTGYEISSFPIKSPLLQSLTGTSYILVRLFIGLSIFLLLLKSFMKWHNLNAFIKLVLPVLCYCSVLYLPMVLVEGCYSEYVMKDFVHILSRFVAGLPIKLSIYNYVELVLNFIIPIIFLFWWLRLVYLGIYSLKLQSAIKIKRAIVLSYLLFFVFQTLTSSAFFLKTNIPTIQSFLILGYNKVETELSLNPPNYFEATYLASKVSENKYMPDYVRYIFKLKQIISEIGLLKGDQNLISEGLRGLRDRNYDYVRDILIEDMKRSSGDNNYYKTAVRKDIEDAVKLRNSASFVDLHKEHIGLAFSWTTAHFIKPVSVMMLDEHGDKTIHIMAPIPHSLISLFP